MNKVKKYNIFIILSTLSKSIIDLFLPVILFNKGLSIKIILLFFLIKYIFLTVFSNTIKFLKLNNTLIIYISFISSFILYLLIYFYLDNIFFLVFISIVYALYLSSYWLYRHNTAMNIIEKKMTTNRTSIFNSIMLISIIPSSLIGGYLIKNNCFILLFVFLNIFNFLSLFFLIKSNSKNKRKKIIIPVQNKIFLFLEQFKFISVSLFPLFIYNSVLKSFSYIGIVNSFIALGSAIYILFISKLMDKNKKDYLSLMCIFLCIISFFRLKITNTIFFIIVCFLEGIFRYTVDSIITRNIYSYGKEYNSLNYNVYIETIKNISRVIIILIYLIFNLNIYTIIFISSISVFLSSFIKLDDGKNGYKKNI